MQAITGWKHISNMKILRQILLGLGWVLFAVYFIGGYVYKQFSPEPISLFTPVAWEDQQAVFEGAISCSLTNEELLERKKVLKKAVFSQLNKKEEVTHGFVYYFDDKDGLAEKITELMLKEKACCPFFKFDLSILPFNKGIALSITGSAAVKEMLKDFEQENS